MKLMPTIVRHILAIVLTVSLTLISCIPAYAFPSTPARHPQQLYCWQDPTCQPVMLEGAETTKQGILRIQDPKLAQDNLVIGIDGASDNPDDIVNLVDSAFKVWASALDSSTLALPEVSVGWAEFSAVEDEALAVHICGAPDKPDPKVCSETDRTKSTILFNTSLLSVRQVDSESGESKDVLVKLFLDSDPLNSSVFGPIEEIANSSSRVERSPILLEKVPDAYVVDLFTVALHEVGHALGYSTANEQIKGVPDSHTGLDTPDVMSLYVPFNTRKCPSVQDVEVIAKVGSYAPEAHPYRLVSDNPCLAGSTGDSPERIENLRIIDRSPEIIEDLRPNRPRQSIFRENLILPRDR